MQNIVAKCNSATTKITYILMGILFV